MKFICLTERGPRKLEEEVWSRSCRPSAGIHNDTHTTPFSITTIHKQHRTGTSRHIRKYRLNNDLYHQQTWNMSAHNCGAPNDNITNRKIHSPSLVNARSVSVLKMVFNLIKKGQYHNTWPFQSKEELGLLMPRPPTETSGLKNYAILRQSARFLLIIDPARGSFDLLRLVLKAPRTQSSDFISSSQTQPNSSPTLASPTTG